MYFCGATIAGPFYEFRDYKNFIERKEHYKEIPSTIIPSLLRLSNAFCTFHFLPYERSPWNVDFRCESSIENNAFMLIENANFELAYGFFINSLLNNFDF